MSTGTRQVQTTVVVVLPRMKARSGEWLALLIVVVCAGGKLFVRGAVGFATWARIASAKVAIYTERRREFLAMT